MAYIERDIEKEIVKYLGSKEILAVIGARQCGKTTFLNHVLDSLAAKGKNINTITFDDLKTLQLFENDTDSFIETNVRGFDIVFIDEVHYSKDSGKKLKYIYDKIPTKILISGSSSPEMSIHSLRYLVGRIFTFTLYPFSFREFLKHKDPTLIKLYDSGKYKKNILDALNRHMEEFLLYGGYPRAVLSRTATEKRKVLEGIYSTYLLKEIKEILDLSDDARLITLLKALSLQTGNIINYNELSTLTGFSFTDIKRYLNILNKTYVCGPVKPFFSNKRTELVKSPKIYFFDTGFRNICIDNFSLERADKGSLYENFIFSELVKKGVYPKYWNTKSKAEVDFVLETARGIVPVEIKSILKDKRTTRSFESFNEKYSPKKAYFLSLDLQATQKRKTLTTHFLPFVKFTSKTP